MTRRERILANQQRRLRERRKELYKHPEAFLPYLNLRARQAKRITEKEWDKAYELNGPPDELADAAKRALSKRDTTEGSTE